MGLIAICSRFFEFTSTKNLESYVSKTELPILPSQTSQTKKKYPKQFIIMHRNVRIKMPFIQRFQKDTNNRVNSTRHMTPLPKVIFVVSIVDVELRIRRMKNEEKKNSFIIFIILPT